MSRVAIVTDTASDLTQAQADAWGITIVPLIVSFGEESFKAGTELRIDDFYRRLLAPGAPFPTTAACSPAAFQQAFKSLLDGGADAVVCITVGGKLSGTYTAARIARDAMPEAPVHVIDSDTATASLLLLDQLAAEASAAGQSAEEIVALVKLRMADIRIFFVVDTLEYLRRGGRISATQAAIGSVLSVKPIITIADGVVETVDKPRTMTKARARLLELLTAEPVERIAVIHTQAPEIQGFAADLARATGVPIENVSVNLVGSSVAPHIGPGAFGAAVLVAPS
jgi:DegV family protein with EDD domain